MGGIGEIIFALSLRVTYRLNIELDLRSLFGLHVHSCTHWLRARNLPPPAFGLKYEGAIGEPRKTTSLCDPLESVPESIE
jgi:hypothetical protein